MMLLQAVPVALLWGAVIYRARTARATTASWYVWLTFVALGTASTMDLPPVVRAVSEVPNLIHLIKYSLVLVAAWCVRKALFLFVPGRFPSRQPRALVLVAALVAMTISWTAAPVHERHADQFTIAFAGEPRLIPLWVAYLGYLGTTLALTAWTQAWYLQLPRSPLRTGMLTVGVGALAGMLYAVERAVYVLVRLLGSAVGEDRLNGPLLVVSTACLVVGALWPSLCRVRVWGQDVIAYHALEPLWRHVTTLAPHVVLPVGPGLTIAERLHGRVVEIMDAITSVPGLQLIDEAGKPVLPADAAAQLHAAPRPACAGGGAVLTLTQLGDESDQRWLQETSQELARLQRSADRDGTWQSRLAQLVTDVLAPANLVLLCVLVVAWDSAGLKAGTLWAALVLTFAPGIPFGLIVFGVRRGWWTDRHIRVRGQRLIPLTISLGAVAGGLVLVSALHGPRPLVALVLAMTAGLAVSLAMTQVWKMSIHGAVAGGTSLVLALTLGQAWLLPCLAGAALVDWSRCRLLDHTLAQVVCGTVVGSVVALSIYGPLH